MAIEVTCPACGKHYRVKDERAGMRIRCRDCQSAIDIPALDEAYDDGQDAEWDEPAAPPFPGRSGAKKKTVVASASSAASFTARKVFGVLAILLSLLMLAGIGMQLMKGNMRSLGGLIVVGAVAGVGFKWLTT